MAGDGSNWNGYFTSSVPDVLAVDDHPHDVLRHLEIRRDVVPGQVVGLSRHGARLPEQSDLEGAADRIEIHRILDELGAAVGANADTPPVAVNPFEPTREFEREQFSDVGAVRHQFDRGQRFRDSKEARSRLLNSREPTGAAAAQGTDSTRRGFGGAGKGAAAQGTPEVSEADKRAIEAEHRVRDNLPDMMAKQSQWMKDAEKARQEGRPDPPIPTPAKVYGDQPKAEAPPMTEEQRKKQEEQRRREEERRRQEEEDRQWRELEGNEGGNGGTPGRCIDGMGDCAGERGALEQAIAEILIALGPVKALQALFPRRSGRPPERPDINWGDDGPQRTHARMQADLHDVVAAARMEGPHVNWGDRDVQWRGYFRGTASPKDIVKPSVNPVRS